MKQGYIVTLLVLNWVPLYLSRLCAYNINTSVSLYSWVPEEQKVDTINDMNTVLVSIINTIGRTCVITWREIKLVNFYDLVFKAWFWIRKWESFVKVEELFFDSEQWWWSKITPFLAYSAKLGRKRIIAQEPLQMSIPNKWQNEIPPLHFS